MNYRRALGYQQITSLTTSTALTIPAQTGFILIQAQSQSVRWRDDGTDPTATVGMLLNAGEVLEYDAGGDTRLEFIEIAPSATLNVSYYGGP